MAFVGPESRRADQCQITLLCVLPDGHKRICRDRQGDLVPGGSRYHTSQAETFRANPGLEIRGSVATEFTEANAQDLLEVVEAAEILEPYLTYYLWNEKLHELRRSPNPAAFFSACLANHGLEIWT
jgi:hypothetical protein